ncbi:MAG: hypothetical protein ACXW32_11980 [Limisphaerales bacterium]
MKTTNAVLSKETETDPNSELDSPAPSRSAQACPNQDATAPMDAAVDPVSHNNLTIIHNNSHDNLVSKNESNSLAVNDQSTDLTKTSPEKNSVPQSGQQYLELMRKLLPPALRNRRFRVNSFVSQLSEDQRVLVFNWLQDRDLSALEVRDRIAAPAPKGFGIKVNLTTLYRLRNLVKNVELNDRIAEMMDATCDILDADTSIDPTPVREAISLLLHSDLLVQCRKQADTRHIERLVNSITRMEKLKLLSRRNPRQESEPITVESITPITRHKVGLSISTHIPRSHQTPPPEGSGAEPQIHRYSIARDAESI